MADLTELIRVYKEKLGDSAKIIVEIGSRDGDDAEFLRETLNADAENIYVFEPNPVWFNKIQEKYPNFKSNMLAISDFSGPSTFNMVITDNKEEVGTSSLRDRTDTWYDDKSVKVTVNVTTMKDFMVENKIDKEIDLVKIDVEGCTLEVLTGFEDLISKVKCFHVELETVQYWQGQSLANEVGDYLISKGFVLVDSRHFGTYSVDEVWINSTQLETQG